jgi:hypothetical protein
MRCTPLSFRPGEVRTAEVHVAEVRTAEIRMDAGMFETPLIPSNHPLPKLSDMIAVKPPMVRHEITIGSASVPVSFQTQDP